MKSPRHLCLLSVLIAGAAWSTLAIGQTSGTLTLSPTSLAFSATYNSSNPSSQALSVSATRSTRFTASATVQSGGSSWLSVSPSGRLTTSQKLTVAVNQSRLAVGTYKGSINLSANERTTTVPVTLTVSNPASSLTVSPTSLTFTASSSNSTPSAQSISVSASRSTSFTAAKSTQSGNWLAISPSGSLTTNRTLAVSVNPAGLAAGSYTGSVTLTASSGTKLVPITLVIGTSTGGGGTGTFKLIGWNDLGMHCQDGKDFSVFSVLPPYNTIHAHLIDGSGLLITSDTPYTVTYQAISDPLTNTMNTTSSAKTNFWQYAAAIGYGALAPDVGLKGYAMPGAANTPQKMTFTTSDNTWTAVGIPMMPYADAPSAPYPVNYFPMMRLVAKNSLGTVLATSDIVLPVSDEMTCSVCHASNTGSAGAKPVNGWVGNADPAKDIKLNILRKHDERFLTTPLFIAAIAQTGYSAAGLEATSSTKPILCANCHGSNALSLPGVAGVEQLTTAMHTLHSNAIDPATNLTLDSGTTRDSCYRCHPGPKTQCARGAMASLKDANGANVIECQSCHGSLSNVANATRNGWLDEPNCQSCHTGTATSNAGQIAYNSSFTSGTIVRVPVDQTFATNPNTPAAGTSLYRFSKGHGGLQCETCHGSTHAEYATPIVNDNVQSTALQGHVGMISECTACHASTPSTVTGGPHGMHPIGASWVSSHHDNLGGGTAQCQACHGTDYRGTILSKSQADRTLAGKSFPRGTIIGCYSCHNGPSGG